MERVRLAGRHSVGGRPAPRMLGGLHGREEPRAPVMVGTLGRGPTAWPQHPQKRLPPPQRSQNLAFCTASLSLTDSSAFRTGQLLAGSGDFPQSPVWPVRLCTPSLAWQVSAWIPVPSPDELAEACVNRELISRWGRSPWRQRLLPALLRGVTPRPA